MKTIPHPASFRIASICLAAGLLVTFASVLYYRHSLADFRAARFAEFVDKTNQRITERVLSYERGLRGLRSALLATGPDRMTLAQFDRVSASRDLEREFPGTLGIGFIQRVKPGDEAAFRTEAARLGRPNLEIRQLAPHDGDRYIIKYLAPDADKRAPIGLDIASEPNRRAAMIAAIRSGEATLTRPVLLLQSPKSGEHGGQGFLLLLPVFPAYPIPDNGAARESAAIGATYAPMLIDRILRDIDPGNDGVSLSLTDLGSGDGAMRFFGPEIPGHAADYATSRTIEVFGRQWRADYHAKPGFIDNQAIDHSLLISVLGVLVSLLGAVLVRRELLARHRREQTAEQLQLLIKNAPTALAMFDRDMRYLAVSQRWIDEFALANKQFLGKSHYALYPYLPESWKAIHQRALNGEEISKDNDRFKRRNGSYRWLHWAIRPWYAADGTIGGVVIFTEDITERHQMTEALQQAKENAENANRSKTLFLDNMSHEMRTPVHQLNGLLSLFQRDTLTDKQIRRVEQMKTSLQRLDTVIGGILTLVNLESKAASVNIRPIDLQEIVESVVASQVGNAQQKGLSIVTAFSPLPPGLRGDADHIRTIITCYLANAIKFSTQGDINVRADCLEESSDTARVRIAVTDRGIGIPADKRDKVFKLFEQIDNSLTRAHGGTGAGLAIARKLAELMGGEVGYDSTPGHGSTFWLTLPLARDASQDNQQDPAE